MSFWSEASPSVKVIVVVGLLAIAYLGVARLAGMPPYSAASDQVVRERGIRH